MRNELMLLIMSGKVAAVRDMIKRNPSLINPMDKLARTPLMEAAIHSQYEICELLIQAGADVNAREKRKWTALHFAAQEDNRDVVKLLLENGAEVDAEDDYKNTPLLRSVLNCKGGRGEVIKLLLQHGADRHHKNKSGNSPWEIALKIANFDIKIHFM